MKAYISQLIKQSLEQISPDEAESVLAASVFDVSYPKAEFGDYASNAAMMSFKNFSAKPAASPMEFAKLLAQKCLALDNQNTFSKIEAIGGFINFTLSNKQLAHQTLEVINNFQFEQIGSGQKVVFEYSSPNTNKDRKSVV